LLSLGLRHRQAARDFALSGNGGTSPPDGKAIRGEFVHKTVEQGAATTVVAAVSPEFAHTGGHYLDDSREAYTVANDASLADHPHGVKEWALDPATAERLWNVSEELLHH
jgi:hypothetical protein